MTTPAVLAALDEAIAQAAADERPALVVQLAARLAALGAGMAAPPPAQGSGPEVGAEPERWITPEQAAGIAGVPKERIYSWAQGQRWASRPSRRCLRIEEKGFRRWLAGRSR